MTPIKRKSLPEISKAIGRVSAQSLHHFIANSPWSVDSLRKIRWELLLQKFKGQAITVIVDETGDRKEGKTTDYVTRQYLGSVGKVDNGLVSVNIYAVVQNITFPLNTRIYKPEKTLKPGDTYKTKTKLAAEMIDEIIRFGFKIGLVLADSLYGESSQFLSMIEEKYLRYVVSIRKDHGVMMPAGQRVRANRWIRFERRFSDERTEVRYVREVIYGKRHSKSYWEITTDPETMPENSTSYVMTNIKENVKKEIGNLYGLRTWIE